ncbi:MAG: TlpA family protein disulfide reductase [Candidatus Krumholzibacteriota bacterium]|nr:TlpA family protein disulfide reductase [Candidatus Krumholzibacteriota bacterium]
MLTSLRFLCVIFVLVLLPAGISADSSKNTESLIACGQANVGEKAPWLSGWTLNEKVFNIQKPFRDDKVERLALVFWASWCVPCRQGMSILSDARDRLEKQGVAVILVNYGEDEKKVKDYISQTAYPFPVVLDPSGRNAKYYLVNREGKVLLPKTVLIGRDGSVEAILGKEGDDYLERILAGK